MACGRNQYLFYFCGITCLFVYPDSAVGRNSVPGISAEKTDSAVRLYLGSYHPGCSLWADSSPDGVGAYRFFVRDGDCIVSHGCCSPVCIYQRKACKWLHSARVDDSWSVKCAGRNDAVGHLVMVVSCILVNPVYPPVYFASGALTVDGFRSGF